MATHETAFDPYLKWLGIRAKDQPPNHYRLLGLDAFETDPDVIANAADARMLQLKSFQNGPYSQFSQRLLNEVAAAKVCLLNADKKAAYDQALREQLAAHATGLGPRASEAAVVSVAPPALPQSTQATSMLRRLPQRAFITAITVAVVMLVALVAILIPAGQPDELAEEQHENENILGPSNPSTASQTDPDRSLAGDTRKSADGTDAEPREKSIKQEVDLDAKRVAPPSSPTITETAVPANTLPAEPAPIQQPATPPSTPSAKGPSLAKPSDLLEGDHREEKPSTAGGPMPGNGSSLPTTPVAPRTAVARLPIPDEAERKTAEKAIRSDFQGDFGRAKSRDQRSAVARKLFAQAAQAGNATERYAFLRLSCDTFAAVIELPRAFEVIDAIAKVYDVDPAEEKWDMLAGVIENPKVAPAVLAGNQELLEAILFLIDSAIAAGELETADEGVEVLRILAKRVKNSELNNLASMRAEMTERARQEAKAAGDAEKTLASDPNDAQANLVFGQWMCFVKNDWATGLPCLAKSGDLTWSALVAAELAAPTDIDQQFALAREWTRQAELLDERAQRPAAARAQYWLELAMPGLLGRDRNRAEELAAKIAPKLTAKLGIHGTIWQGNVAAAANGTTVSGNGGQTDLIDGKIPPLLSQSGIASARWPCQWTVTFKEVYCLREIALKFPDVKNSIHSFTLETSPDGLNYFPLVVRGVGHGWARLRFFPRPVKAIRLHGISQTAGSTFYVSELEAYTDMPLGK